MMTFLKLPKKPLPWILGLVGGGMLLVGVATYNAVMGESRSYDPDEYTVLVQEESLRFEVEANGTVQPIQSVNISPQRAGIVKEIANVDQGTRVKKDQPLAIMEHDQQRWQALQARANAAQAEANVQATAARQQQTAIGVGIDRARGAQANQQLQASQWQGQSAIADLIATRNRLIQQDRQAQARIIAANAQVQEALARIPTEVKQAQARMVAAQQRMEKAKIKLERYARPAEEGAVSLDTVDNVTLEYRNAQAELAEAQAQYQNAVKTAEPEINQLRASLQEASAAKAEIVQTGPQEIRQKEATVQEARANFQQQQAAVAEAELNLRQQQAAVEEAKANVQQQQAALGAAQAQFKEAEVLVNQSLIRAPFDGIITQKYTNQGAFVTPTTSASTTNSATSTSIFSIARGLEIVAKVPEVDIGGIQPKQLVEIQADAYPNRTFRGQVRLVAPEAVVEQNVTSFEVRILLEPGVEELLSGMNVDVTFLGEQLPASLVVPTVAIVTEDGERGVYVVDENGEPEFKPVTFGATIGDKTQVLAGMLPGERVFTDLPEEFEPEEEEE